MAKSTNIIIVVWIINFCISSSSWADSKHTVEPEATVEETIEKNNLPIEGIKNFVRVYTRIKEQFIGPINDTKMLNNAVKGMIDNLDAHSSFLDSELYGVFKRNLTGKYGGVGLEIAKKNGEIIIMTPTFDGPAYNAGFKSGDQIIKIDDTIIRNHNIEEVNKMLEGPPNTIVNLYVKNIENQVSSRKLKRTLVISPSIHKNDLGNSFIHIRISQFIKNTSGELADKFGKNSKDVRGLIIDLRDNPGGLLDAAIKTTDLFLSKGLIVSIKDRTGDIVENFTATPPMLINSDIPIIVIINEGTASAAEIMAGALKDNARSILIGKNSFGKGSVQSLFSLPNKTAAKITTAFYLTPSGENIKDKGIEPDIYIEPLTFDLDRHPNLAENKTTYKNHIINGSVNKKVRGHDFNNLAKHDYTLFQAVKALEALTVLNE